MRFVVHILERTCWYIFRGSLRTGRFLWYFEEGMRHGYPLCCIAHFSWNGADPKYRKARWDGRARGPASERGAVHVNEESCYVPCWFHLYIRRPANWRAHKESPPHHPFHPKLFYMEPKLGDSSKKDSWYPKS